MNFNDISEEDNTVGNILSEVPEEIKEFFEIHLKPISAATGNMMSILDFYKETLPPSIFPSVVRCTKEIVNTFLDKYLEASNEGDK